MTFLYLLYNVSISITIIYICRSKMRFIFFIFFLLIFTFIILTLYILLIFLKKKKKKRLFSSLLSEHRNIFTHFVHNYLKYLIIHHSFISSKNLVWVDLCWYCLTKRMSSLNVRGKRKTGKKNKQKRAAEFSLFFFCTQERSILIAR